MRLCAISLASIDHSIHGSLLLLNFRLILVSLRTLCTLNSIFCGQIECFKLKLTQSWFLDKFILRVCISLWSYWITRAISDYLVYSTLNTGHLLHKVVLESFLRCDFISKSSYLFFDLTNDLFSANWCLSVSTSNQTPGLNYFGRDWSSHKVSSLFRATPCLDRRLNHGLVRAHISYADKTLIAANTLDS